MAAPQGYSSLGVIGFTDQGTYDNSATYYINDLVHYLGNIYRCKVDETVGIAPAENVNWTVFVGTPTNIVEELIAPVEVSPSANAYTAGRQFIYNDNLYEVVKSIAVGDALVNISDDPNGNIKDADRVETQVLQTRKMIAPIEESPSINAYSVGDQLIYNGLLYNVTAAIAIGDSLTVGTNISLSDSVVEQLKTINTTLGDTDISGVGNSVTDAISSLNNDLTPQTLTPTKASPISDVNVYASRTGNVVSVTIDATSTVSIPENTPTLLMSGLPNNACVISDGVLTLNTVSTYRRIWVDNSGNVYAFISPAYSDTLYATLTYITNE